MSTRNITLESISLEADVLANLTNTVKKFFPSLLEELSPALSCLNGLVNFKKTSSELSKKDAKIVTSAHALHFDELGPMKFSIPQGFKGSLAVYQEELLSSLEYCKKTSIEAVNDFYVELASVVSNKNMKIGLKDTTPETKKLTASRELQIETISKYFTKGSNEVTGTYKDNVGQHASLPDIFRKEALLKDKLEGIKPEDLNKRVKDISRVMEILVKQAEAGHIEKLSPEVVRNLAEGLYELANQIEFVAATYYRAIAALNSVEGLRDSLIKRLGL